MTCSDDFVWDYFGSSVAGSRSASLPEDRLRP
jgi:hypothetical protein